MPTTPEVSGGSGVVLDCDAGIDDAVALVLAARSPELKLLGVVTSYGNTEVENATANATHLLRLLGRQDVSIIPGSEAPISRPRVTAPETHGPKGIGYATADPVGDVSPNPLALLDFLSDHDDPLALVTLGPLTNLARALEHDSQLVRSRVARHLGMFGNIHERGNTNRWADFNAWADPEAVAVVFDSGLATQMVGLDVTRQVNMSGTEVARLSKSSDELTRWLGSALQFYVEFHRAQERLDGCVINDMLPVAELIMPGGLGFERMTIRVETKDGEARGRTVPAANGNEIDVALSVDVQAMRHLLNRVFGKGWQDDGSTQ